MENNMSVYMICNDTTQEYFVGKTTNILQQIRLHYNTGSITEDLHWEVLKDELDSLGASKYERYYMLDPPSRCAEYTFTRKFAGGQSFGNNLGRR